MARIRTIKPEFWTDEKLSHVSRDARLLFIGLLTYADDMGRLHYSPVRLKNQIFPADNITDEAIDRWTEELAETELIRLYKAGSHSQRYLWIPGFLRHQKIDRPGHSDLPAHPKDYRPDCRCGLCKAHRLGEHSGNVPAGTQRIGDSSNRGISESQIQPPEVGSRSKNLLYPESSKDSHIHTPDEGKTAQPSPLSEASDKERFTRRAEVDEIASKMLRTLEIESNSLLFQVVTKTIEVVARVRSCTVQAATQRIWARAALLAAESPPDNWVQWFGDARYEYVKQGDKRLQDRRLEARPVCGKGHCEEGWRVVRANGHDIAQRCEDCVQLWRDQGYSSD